MEKARSLSARSFTLNKIAPKMLRQSADASCLRDYANRHRMKGNFNDVTINIGERNFPANRLVLSCFSTFFEELFTTDVNVTQMSDHWNWNNANDDVKPEAMEQIIEFIYTGNIQIHAGNVSALLSASTFMKLKEVKQFCLDYLETAIAVPSAITIMNLTDNHDCESLKKEVDRFILNNLQDIVATDGFKSLSLSEMLDCLFKHDRTRVGEIIIYKAIVQWVSHNIENRSGHFQSLFRKIDLSLLPVEYLEDVITHEPLVRNDLNCLKRLHDAIVQAERQSRNKDYRKRIVSLGGHRTLSKVKEIYNLTYGENAYFPDLPQGVSSLCAVVLNNYLYCIGGQTVPLKNEKSTNQVYRMSLNNIDPHWEKVTPTIKKRYVMGAAAMHGNIFVIGGTDEVGCKLSSGEYFSPSLDEWKKISPLMRPRSGSAVVACKGCIYAIGGFGNGKYLDAVEQFNMHSNVWNDVTPMQVARRWLAAVVLNDLIYVIGGQPERENRSILKSVEVYDPNDDSWTFVSDMNTERAACSACVMQGKIYVTGGLNKHGNPIRTIESYHPYDNEWRVVGRADEDLWHHAVVALQ